MGLLPAAEQPAEPGRARGPPARAGRPRAGFSRLKPLQISQRAVYFELELTRWERRCRAPVLPGDIFNFVSEGVAGLSIERLFSRFG